MSNPLCARVDVVRYRTGLWSAIVDCDHGLPERTRVYWSRGHLSRAQARRNGIALANAIGRAAIVTE